MIESNQLTRVLTIGFGLSAGAIFLFVILWITFGAMGLDNLPRLLLSLCLPPLFLALLVGGYALVKAGQNADKTAS